METVRAKFFVRAKEQTKWGSQAEVVTTIKLNAVADGSEENKNFFKYTPTGTIDLGVVNNSLADNFSIGDYFYVDFTKAE